MKREQVMWMFAGLWLTVNIAVGIINPEWILFSNVGFMAIGFFWLLPNKHKWPLS